MSLPATAPQAPAPSADPLTRIPVGLGPIGIAMAPDGAHAYVTNFGSGTVSVIDTAGP
ncbi:hypothetical protein [Streptomyces cuspidosporus]|uniref:YncE family protein n=1 Tax=Streptomyces cuspidosporus TaxID=66882 RepID=A0ABN3FQD6_9ACTN